MAAPVVNPTQIPTPVPTPSSPYIAEPSIELPKPKRWWSRWLPDLSHLPNPGKYEEYAREAQDVTTTREYFEGMKFNFTRGLSEYFAVQHFLQMGSADANGGGTYAFAPSVTSRSKRTQIQGRFDGDGRVMGNIAHAITPRLMFMSQAHVSQEQSIVHLETVYAGDSFTAAAKLEGPSVVDVNMMQSIGARASLGMQLLHIVQPNTAITCSSVAARVWSGTEIQKQTQERVPRWVAAISMGSMTPFHACFTWHTTAKADFSTELALHPRQQDGGLESVWCAGAKYQFQAGFVRARVDSKARVGVFIEEWVSPNMSAYLCGDLDHLQNKYKFGFGINIQS